MATMKATWNNQDFTIVEGDTLSGTSSSNLVKIYGIQGIDQLSSGDKEAFDLAMEHGEVTLDDGAPLNPVGMARYGYNYSGYGYVKFYFENGDMRWWFPPY